MIIHFSNYNFRIREEGNNKFIFDVVRKKFVALTPEEQVRQHWIHYLITDQKYPRSLIAVEMNIVLNGLSKRCDLVVFDKEGKPFLIIECKAPEVKLTQKVFDQVARYNLTLKVPYLVVTNGSTHYCCAIDFEKMGYQFIEMLPVVIQ